MNGRDMQPARLTALLPAAQSRARRLPILEAMGDLASQGIDCDQCEGTCCTQSANSMQVGLLEALEVLLALQAQGRCTEALRESLKTCVRDYRLDRDIDLGRGRQFRRTYRCPFFAGQVRGCTLPLESKPHGCLAFNAEVPGQTQGGACRSDQALLTRRQEKFGAEEEKLQEACREILSNLAPHAFGPGQEKLPLPVALLTLWDHALDGID